MSTCCTGLWFRRLFAVRVTSQFGDGVFQAALASYVLFSPEKQPKPGAIALTLTVMLLPFSILGPFAGVFLDRWPRRQVLAFVSLARLGIVGVLAGLVAAGIPDLVFYVFVVLSLSVNRFVLAGLSASLPHTVVEEDLVTANALDPDARRDRRADRGPLGTTVGSRWADELVLLVGRARVRRRRTARAPHPATAARSRLRRDRPAAREAVRHVVVGLVGACGTSTSGAHPPMPPRDREQPVLAARDREERIGG